MGPTQIPKIHMSLDELPHEQLKAIKKLAVQLFLLPLWHVDCDKRSNGQISDKLIKNLKGLFLINLHSKHPIYNIIKV